MEFPELKNFPPHEPDRFLAVDGLDADPAMTNRKRAEWVGRHMSVNFLWSEDESDFSDLICNLLHHVHSRGFDPADILSSAANNFAAEAGPLPS